MIKTRNDFFHRTIYIKGEIINNLSVIEYFINFMLGNYMSKDKLFFALATINKINFNTRIDMFKHFLSDLEPEHKTKHPDLLSKIGKMQDLRNKFAHSILQIPKVDDYSKLDEFSLLKTDKFNADSFSHTVYKLSEHQAQMKEIHEVIFTLGQISGLNSEFLYN